MFHDTTTTNDMMKIRVKQEYQRYIQYGIGAMVILLLFYFYATPYLNNVNVSAQNYDSSTQSCRTWEVSHLQKQKQCRYTSKYPFTRPSRVKGGVKYAISAVADLDEERSKVEGEKFKWKSYLKTGYLLKSDAGDYKVVWENEITLTSRLNEKGRGLELSELCAFNGHLYTVDDRTGLVYRIQKDKVIPWVILMDGNGDSTKGFKSEWMTVKDGSLFVGGLGKEWTTKAGEFLSYDPLFVKSIDQYGAVVHHNWTDNFLKVRAKAGITFPGYMIHEAVMWSSIKKRWYFLPRRMSKLEYDDVADEKRGTNVLISCKSDFTDLQIVYVGEIEPTHGFSSFKFLPDSNDRVAVALKSKEVEGIIQSYILVFEVDTGKILMTEQFIANDKYEGVEFT